MSESRQKSYLRSHLLTVLTGAYAAGALSGICVLWLFKKTPEPLPNAVLDRVQDEPWKTYASHDSLAELYPNKRKNVTADALPTQHTTANTPREFLPYPIGSLGFPFGTLMTIEGTVPERSVKGPQRYVEISRIDGTPLAKAKLIRFDSAVFEPGEHVSLYGYETGRMIGIPIGAPRPSFESNSGHWHLDCTFVVIRRADSS